MGSACGTLIGGPQKAEVFDGSQIQDADLDKAVNLSRSGMIANQKKALQYMLKVSVDENIRLKLVRIGCLETALPQLRSTSKSVQLLSCRVIGNLALSELNRMKITQEGGIPPICGVLQDPLLSTKMVVVETLINVSGYSDARPKIVDENVMPQLMPLLDKHTLEVELTCLSLLSKLCQHKKCYARLVRDGILHPMFEIVKSTVKSIRHKRFAAIVIAELCAHTESHNAIMTVEQKRAKASKGQRKAADAGTKIDGIKVIFDMCSHFAEDIRLQGSIAVARLAEDPLCKKPLMQHNVVPHIVNMMKSGKLAMQKNGASAVKFLSEDPMFQVKILREGVLPPLLKLSRCGNDILEASSGLAIANLASNIVNRPAMLRKGAFKPLLYNARFGHTSEIKSASLAVLCSIWHTEPYRKKQLIRKVCEKFRALLERKKQVKKVSTKKKFTVTDDRGLGQEDPDEGASQASDEEDF